MKKDKLIRDDRLLLSPLSSGLNVEISLIVSKFQCDDLVEKDSTSQNRDNCGLEPFSVCDFVCFGLAAVEQLHDAFEALTRLDSRALGLPHEIKEGKIFAWKHFHDYRIVRIRGQWFDLLHRQF